MTQDDIERQNSFRQNSATNPAGKAYDLMPPDSLVG